MQKPFSTQPELFVTSADLEHPSLQGFDGAEAVLDWAKLEKLLIGIYAGKTGRPVIPPFLMGPSCRIYAAVFSFMAGVMPPMPMLGRSLL